MITINKLVKVNSLQEAYELNQKRTNVVLGGFMWLKMGNRTVGTAIDLSNLGLDGIEETKDEFRIGCMTSLRELELHEGLNRAFQGAVKEAVHHIVGVQFRNGATVGGSIVGRYGFSDVLTCLMALDCWVELYKGGLLPLREYAGMKGDNDILVRIIIKKDGRRISYQSQRMAKTDFPQLAVAVARKEEQLVVSVGARPMRAEVIEKPEHLLNEGSSESEIAAFAQWAAGRFIYGTNMRGGKEYRKQLASILIKRAVKGVLDHGQGGAGR